VSDQASAEHNGTFLGWNMVFWGSVIDSAKAVLYEVSHEDPVLPPHEEPQPLPSASTTKPTVYLSTKEISSSTSTASAAPQSTADLKVAAAEGTVSAEALPTPSKEPSQISIIMDGLTHKLWTYIILVVVASLVGRIFLWRCRVRALRSAYVALRGDGNGNVPLAGGRRSGDWDDDANEQTGLNSKSYSGDEKFLHAIVLARDGLKSPQI
jgi:kexin